MAAKSKRVNAITLSILCTYFHLMNSDLCFENQLDPNVTTMFAYNLESSCAQNFYINFFSNLRAMKDLGTKTANDKIE